MWEEINETYFSGELQPLAAIGWEETSGEDGIGAHGMFVAASRCIIIDQKYRFDADAIREGDENERAKCEIAYRLMMHEMVHQAVHQREGKKGGHGAPFLAEAERISRLMGEEPPTAENVLRWPLHRVASFNQTCSQGETPADEHPKEPDQATPKAD